MGEHFDTSCAGTRYRSASVAIAPHRGSEAGMEGSKMKLLHLLQQFLSLWVYNILDLVCVSEVTSNTGMPMELEALCIEVELILPASDVLDLY